MKKLLTILLTLVMAVCLINLNNSHIKATESNNFTVTFDMQGHGTQVDPQSVVSGQCAMKPGNPTAPGYLFGGWYNEATCQTAYDFSTPVTANITLYAKWTAEYTITYHENSGTWAGGYTAPTTYTSDDAVTLPTSDQISRSGYKFDGWYDNSSFTGSAITTIPQGSTGNKEYWAKWTMDPLPFTITATEDGTTKVKLNKYGTVGSLQYSTDGGNTFNNYTYGTDISLSKDGSVLFKTTASTSTSLSKDVSNYVYITADNKITASGNIMSLVDQNNYSTNKTIPGDYCFYKLFVECSNLISIDGLELPATTLTKSCYSTMFRKCTSLTSIPEGLLPATNLSVSGSNVTHCYQDMFSGCTSLKSIPAKLLPATTLVSQCYLEMFEGCTSLTSIPWGLLPATTLKAECYQEMFKGCTNLTNIPNLPATALANNCYTSMFEGCTNLKVSATKVDNYVIPFKVTDSGTANNPTSGMFWATGGTFTTGTPLVGTQYYIEAPSKPTECSGTACSISAAKGTNNIVAHINGVEANQVTSLTSGGSTLVEGKDYTLYKGSVGIVFNKTFVDTLDAGNHQIDVKYYDGATKTYTLNITITGDSPTPSPDPSPTYESCEKVIGPTWHWNESKGICEDYGVVGTSTR